jgi:hypothetical protein
MLKNMQKNPILRGSGSGPNPSTSRPRIKNSALKNFQLSSSRNVEKIGNRRTDGQRNDFNRALFLKKRALKTCQLSCFVDFSILHYLRRRGQQKTIFWNYFFMKLHKYFLAEQKNFKV